MELILLASLLLAPTVVVGEVDNVRRAFVNHEDRQLAAQLPSAREYRQFTAEFNPYRYSNITLDLPGTHGLSLFTKRECVNPGYGQSTLLPCAPLQQLILTRTLRQ
jgi:hypothetical protein